MTATLHAHRAKRRRWTRLAVRAAVAVIVKVDDEGLAVLMIQRATRSGDRWSGHIGFPGGLASATDLHRYDTARRETREEVGLALRDQHYAGRLSDRLTVAHNGRQPLILAPYVFHAPDPIQCQPNDEVATTLWVPLAFIQDDNNRRQQTYRRGLIRAQLPYYRYRGHRIWGLSLRVLDELAHCLRNSA